MDSRKMRLLLVEDSPIQAKIANRLLTEIGFDVEHTTTGEEAVVMSRDNQYDLGIFDIGLDGMLSGDQAVEEIRQLGEENGGYPIFAVTAHVSEEAIQHYKSIGINEVFEKPIKKQRIIEAFEKIRVFK